VKDERKLLQKKTKAEGNIGSARKNVNYTQRRRRTGRQMH
jgi:hypothetical protein